MAEKYGALVGEIWQDAEGCLLVCAAADESEWYAFGTGQPITLDHPLTAHPLTLVADQTGKIHATQLNYPDRTVFR